MKNNDDDCWPFKPGDDDDYRNPGPAGVRETLLFEYPGYMAFDERYNLLLSAGMVKDICAADLRGTFYGGILRVTTEHDIGFLTAPLVRKSHHHAMNLSYRKRQKIYNTDKARNSVFVLPPSEYGPEYRIVVGQLGLQCMGRPSVCVNRALLFADIAIIDGQSRKAFIVDHPMDLAVEGHGLRPQFPVA